MTHCAQPDQTLLGLLSRSRQGASTTPNTLDSRVIRLSRLRAERGPALAELKVARDIGGAIALRNQRRAIAEIASQPGLDDHWCRLLPRILSFDERPDAAVSVESYRPGTPFAEALAAGSGRVEELTARALEAIAPLHRATARSIVVDNLAAVRQWVAGPVDELAQVCRRHDSGLLPELEQWETTLTRAIVGRRMTVCWTHGAFVPDNIRLAGETGPVDRIVGWYEARADRPALVDVYLMTLTASCQAQGVDLGALVGARLAAGGLSDSERRAMSGAADRCDAVDECVAISLAWLMHTAALCRSPFGRSTDDRWMSSQVVPVLEAVTAWLGHETRGAPGV